MKYWHDGSHFRVVVDVEAMIKQNEDEGRGRQNEGNDASEGQSAKQDGN